MDKVQKPSNSDPSLKFHDRVHKSKRRVPIPRQTNLARINVSKTSSCKNRFPDVANVCSTRHLVTSWKQMVTWKDEWGVRCWIFNKQTAVLVTSDYLKGHTFSKVTPCKPAKVSRRFGRKYRFHLQARRVRRKKQHKAESKQSLG
jgi:hypothetical protein